MSYLKIKFASGREERVELSKRQPASIGEHPSSDVCIADEGVGMMHCRVSWNKTGYEVVAAVGEGVDVNGTRVQKARLKPGDVLRVGSADLVFSEAAADSLIPGVRPPDDEDGLGTFGLRPLTDEIEIPLAEPPPRPPKPDRVSQKRVRNPAPITAEEIVADEPDVPRREKQSPRRVRPRAEVPEAPEAEKDQKAERAEKAERARGREREAAKARRGEERSRESDRQPGERRPEGDDAGVVGVAPEVRREGNDTGQEAAGKFVSRSVEMAAIDAASDAEAIAPSQPVMTRLREHLHAQQRRPGDRDALRSPLVLLLGGGAAALVLVGLTFHLITSRHTTQARFDEARQQMDEGKYSQAIRDFENFVALHPRDRLADEARVNLGLARIERSISGATPDWSNGLQELRDFITTRRDLDDFGDLHDEIFDRASRIAQGSAASAGKMFNRDLLAISDEASSLLSTYAPQEAPPTELLKRIETSRRSSEASILKHEAFTEAVSKIDAALGKQQPLAAIVTRRELINRYDEFARDRKLQEKLEKTLEVERQLVRSEAQELAALALVEDSSPPAPLTLLFHARSRSDEVSVGRVVVALAADCVYGIDSVTGFPLWRRVIGWDTPFFPLQLQSPVAGVLLFDTTHRQLMLADPLSGKVLWSQSEVGRVVDRPVVDKGQLYVVNDAGQLNRIELESGKLTTRLDFPQPITSLAALNDGKRLVVAGDEEVVYTLTQRPLECVAVSYTAHRPESISAPLLAMGALVLLAENLPGDQCRLRVFDTRDPSGQLEEIAQEVIAGHVLDEPEIRGRDVFIPSTGERVSSFSVSDDPNQPPFTVGPRFAAKGGELTPVYLQCGPDRQLWMASRNLRRLQLTTDTIQPDQKLVELGTASQPLQDLGDWLYVGRHPTYSAATILTQTNREDLTSQWQVTMGGRLLAYTADSTGSEAIAITEAGDIFRVPAEQILSGGFHITASSRLSLPEGLRQPLIAAEVAEGRIAVACGAPQPQLWVVNRLGQAGRGLSLPEDIETAPVLLGERLLLPLSGRLHLLRSGSGEPVVQDLTLAQGNADPPPWKQVVAVDDALAVAITQPGELILVSVQTSPQPFLSDAGRLNLETPIDFRGDVSAGRLAVASGRRCWILDAATLDPRAEQALPNPVSNDLWYLGDLLLVETGGTELHAFQTEPELQRLWTLPLSESLGGRPLIDSQQLILALRDGTLITVDSLSGQVRKRHSVGQAVTSGPRRIGSELVVATVDGSLARASQLLEENGQ